MKKNAVFFCTCILLLGCTRTPKVDIAAEADVIRNLENQWVIANQTKDIAKVMTFFSPEGVQMMPDKDIVVGLQSIQREFELSFADTTLLWETFTWTNDFVEVSASGDLAYVRGTNRLNIKTPDGIVEGKGKGVDIWKKIDGEWKCVVGIYNQ